MDVVGISLLAAAAAALASCGCGFAYIVRRTTARTAVAPYTDSQSKQTHTPHSMESPAIASSASIVEEKISAASSQPPTEVLLSSTGPRQVRIVAIKGMENREWLIERSPMIIGRSQEAQCFVPSLTVSRKHAIIELKGDQIILTDCGSRNGTYVQGVRIDQPVVLRNGDTIEMGEIGLRVFIG